METQNNQEEREKLNQQKIQDKINREKKKKLTKKIVIYSILVLIVASLVYFPISNSKKPGKYDDFAKCLAERGAKMYGSFQCSHCIAQKKDFGKSVQYIDYIECGPLGGPINKICIDQNIRGYPTWKINNQTVEGRLSLEELSRLGNCELKA